MLEYSHYQVSGSSLHGCVLVHNYLVMFEQRMGLSYDLKSWLLFYFFYFFEGV